MRYVWQSLSYLPLPPGTIPLDALRYEQRGSVGPRRWVVLGAGTQVTRALQLLNGHLSHGEREGLEPLSKTYCNLLCCQVLTKYGDRGDPLCSSGSTTFCKEQGIHSWCYSEREGGVKTLGLPIQHLGELPKAPEEGNCFSFCTSKKGVLSGQCA